MAGQISATCRNFVLDPATEVLSGECKDGQGSNEAWQPTSLDHNACLVYDDERDSIFWRQGGNFGAQCDSCHIVWTKDPIWGNQLLNIACICSGTEASFELDRSYIDNKYGTLVCWPYS
ncbi:hypothetical protein N658DRAFT_510437 [Parathielavia hyrcaniae]|uniref:Cyanovirin-N domain-containing protein n=1 Tax=Parathielavia hyrcaniae TaxID=113614 RepID=A0AAN6PWG1_9PEZI|nr:hypothetical protein N658DRAFT_510437 [Parathielavia hyrcaniae]